MGEGYNWYKMTNYQALERKYLGVMPEIDNKLDYRYQMILIMKIIFEYLYLNRFKEITLGDIISQLNTNGIFIGAKTLYNNYVSTFVRKGVIVEKKHRGRVDYVFRWNLGEGE